MSVLSEIEGLMLTTCEKMDLIFDSLRRSASGYLLKNMPSEELIQVVEQVHAGGAPASTQIARRVVSHFHQIRKPQSETEPLPREYEILGLLAKGYLYGEIADQLAVSLSAVRSHLHFVYEKTACPVTHRSHRKNMSSRHNTNVQWHPGITSVKLSQ